MAPPLVLLIDLDGTVQGDISPQVEEHILLNKLSISQNKKSLSNDYTKGLLRPYFTNFVNLIKKEHAGRIEMFVYTASEKQWAYHIVPIIESITQVKFNRPIFTRNECDMDKEAHKSLVAVKPKIMRSLRKKYSGLTHSSSLDNMIYLIDNNHVLQESKFLLKCPTYGYAVNVDILRNISPELRKKYHAEISSHCGLPIGRNMWEMYKNVYLKLYNNYSIIAKTNIRYSKDNYWKKVYMCFVTLKYDYRQIIHNIKQLGRN
tara:strand:+ start:3389 stop:4171 length:783 start_codon:yes stop_codon:yes gene_type:complete